MQEHGSPPESVVRERPVIPDALAERYASTPMVMVWSPEANVVQERQFWIAVMRAQSQLGVPIPAEAIDAYERVIYQVDLGSMRRREFKTRHDVMARLEEFNFLAGYDFAHKAMTSRDLTDNVEGKKIKDGLVIVRDRSVATLARLGNLAVKYADVPIAARTHNVPAQPTLLGKKFANAGEQLLFAFEDLENLIARYPLRGIKGPVGTQADQLQLLGDPDKVMALEKAIAEQLGFAHVMGSVGQVYPRSLDYKVVSTLMQLVAGPSDLAMSMRLMAGNDQMTEGFKEGQVGSSGMPHKMNARSGERMFALTKVLGGYVNMATGLIGNQWNEGDVSDSVIRRVMLPDSFFAADGLLQTSMTILDECGFYPKVIQAELDKYHPFLTTTRILNALQKRGMGRNEAHAILKEHSTKQARRMREEGTQENTLFDLYAGDERLGMTRAEIDDIVGDPSAYVGRAPEQIADFAAQVHGVVSKYLEAATYIPEPIL
ncbi:adenylosuccinate lyase [Candidatus Roizmanbacteria bacterium]|nr:adenylosuccinate lyase [Candidatus Roizmanbacteria bacterium]